MGDDPETLDSSGIQLLSKINVLSLAKKSSTNLKNLPLEQKKNCMGFRSRHISTIAGMCFAGDSESIYDLSFMKKEGNQTSLPTTI
jgi:hypothetical protein